MHIYVTKIGVLGDMTPEMGCNINKLPKMHTLCRVDIRQSIYPQNWFTGAICDVTKKPKKTKKDSICSVAKWVLVVTTMSLVVISFKFCKKNRWCSFQAVRGRNLPYPIALVILLYNSKYEIVIVFWRHRTNAYKLTREHMP